MISARLLIVQMMIARMMMAANKREKEKGKVPQGMAYSFRVVNSGLVTTLANHRLSDTKGVRNTFFLSKFFKYSMGTYCQVLAMLQWVEAFMLNRRGKYFWKNMIISITYHSPFENLRIKLCTDIIDIKTPFSWEVCKNTKIQNKWITYMLSAPCNHWSLCAFFHSLKWCLFIWTKFQLQTSRDRSNWSFYEGAEQKRKARRL